jgi:hypothetical protein
MCSRCSVCNTAASWFKAFYVNKIADEIQINKTRAATAKRIASQCGCHDATRSSTTGSREPTNETAQAGALRLQYCEVLHDDFYRRLIRGVAMGSLVTLPPHQRLSPQVAAGVWPPACRHGARRVTSSCKIR